jgi:hypothetical protein
MADEKKTNSKNIHTSYVGTFKADSFEVGENGVATAVLETPGADGAVSEKVIKGYNDNAKTLEDAVKAGGEVIVRGTLLGGGKNPHMGIYATGPEQIAGVVAGKVRSNLDSYEAEGKQPYVNAFVLVERGEHKIGTPVTAFGDDALALAGIEEGGRIEVPARATQEKRGDDWTSIYRVTGAGTVEPAPEKEADETPAP